MAAQEIVFPELHPKNRKHGTLTTVPRRYEETRPATVQQFSHHRILDLGTALHRQLTQQFDQQKLHAIEESKQTILAEAEVQKQKALEVQKVKIQAQHEKALKKLNKQHECTLKEEIIRLTAQFDRLHQDDLEQVKQHAQNKLQEAVQQTEQIWQKKLLDAVESARSKERQIAKDEAVKVKKQHMGELETLRQRMDHECQKALTSQHECLDKVKQTAVTAAREEEQVAAQNRLEHIKDLFEKQIAILHGKIGMLRQDILELRQYNDMIIKQKIAIQEELVETRKEFQCFIDIVHPFNKTAGAGYVLPPLKSCYENMETETPVTNNSV